MSDDNKERILARMRKMLAMASDSRGEAAEADAARRMLDKMMAKYGVTEADLAGEQQPRRYVFTYKTKLEHDLTVQVLCKALGTSRIRTAGRRGFKGMGVDMTPAQHIEAEVMLSAYLPALRKHMESAFLAFILANDIRSDGSGDTEGQAPAEPANPERAPTYDPVTLRAMTAATRVTPVLKQLKG